MPWLLKNDAKLIAYMIAGEGNYPFIYLDSRGFPTYGVGHLIYRTDRGDPEKELKIFIDLCSSLKVVFKRDKGKGEPATADDVKAEVRNLIGIGQKTISGYEERRAKALKHIHPTAFVSSAAPPAQSSVQTLGTALHDVLDFAELQTATKLATKKYNNLDAPHFWSKQATLYTDAADTQLMLQNDIENLVLLPLKRGGPWGQKVGDLPEPIQTIVIDIVFNAGVNNWKKFDWCKKVREKIDAKDYEGLAKVIQSHISEKGGNSAPRAHKRAAKAREYAAYLKGLNDRNLLDKGLGSRSMLA